MHALTLEANPTKKQVQELAKQSGSCLSLLFHFSGDPHGREARLGGLLRHAHDQLVKGGAEESQVKARIAAVRSRIMERLEQAHSGAIAVFSSGDQIWAFDLVTSHEEFAEAGTVFNISPLIASISQDTEFYLLALSQKHARLLHCTMTEAIEVPMPPEIPTNLLESTAHETSDHKTSNHVQGGKMGSGHSHAGISVNFGSSAEADKKDEYLRHFFNEIDKQLQSFLADKQLPLIVAGVDYEIALYRKISEYPMLVAGGVTGAPDGLKGPELHERALEVLKAHNESRFERLLAIHERAAGQRVSSDMTEIVAGARDGKVQYLFVADDAKSRGSFDEATRSILDSGENLVNWTMLQTLAHRGDVIELPREKMPKQTDVSAYFRY